MDLDDLEHIVIIGYTLWKWKTDYDEKQKKRIKAKPTKRKTKKRFKKQQDGRSRNVLANILNPL